MMTLLKSKPFSIRIFLADGIPDGLRTIEKSNWSGRGVVCPRALFNQSKQRDEFGKAGVYLLIGPPRNGGVDANVVYIGEGDPVRSRLESHYRSKDSWTIAYFFVSKDDNLNKAHIQYLESKLVALAKEANRCDLENRNTPMLPSFSEADIADAEGFLEEMLLCLPVLGVSIFEKPVPIDPAQDILIVKGKGAEASGYEAAEGFIVCKGSLVVAGEVASIHSYLANTRKALQERGVLVPDGPVLRFSQDYTFNSPSTAAGVVLGRSANGRTEWKNKSGRTLKEIQEGNAL